MKSYLKIGGILCLGLAIISWLMETAFYGDVSQDGVLQESLFLPLAFIFAVVGVVCLAAHFTIRR